MSTEMLTIHMNGVSVNIINLGIWRQDTFSIDGFIPDTAAFIRQGKHNNLEHDTNLICYKGPAYNYHYLMLYFYDPYIATLPLETPYDSQPFQK